MTKFHAHSPQRLAESTLLAASPRDGVGATLKEKADGLAHH